MRQGNKRAFWLIQSIIFALAASGCLLALALFDGRQRLLAVFFGVGLAYVSSAGTLGSLQLVAKKSMNVFMMTLLAGILTKFLLWGAMFFYLDRFAQIDIRFALAALMIFYACFFALEVIYLNRYWTSQNA